MRSHAPLLFDRTLRIHASVALFATAQLLPQIPFVLGDSLSMPVELGFDRAIG